MMEPLSPATAFRNRAGRSTGTGFVDPAAAHAAHGAPRIWGATAPLNRASATVKAILPRTGIAKGPHEEAPR